MTPILDPAAFAVLEATPGTLRALLEGLPEQAIATPGPEGWSPRDIVAHLLSIQGPALAERVGLMLDHDDPAIPNVDEDRALAVSGMREWPLPRLLDEFAARRADIVRRLRSTPDVAYARTGRHEVAGSVSAADVVHHITFHDLLHIRQICELLLDPIERQRGAMRAAFRYR